MGDFNEGVGGASVWPQWKDNLSVCLVDSGLYDLRFSGCFFTWSNHRSMDPILRKLDRALVNLKCESTFQASEAFFLPS